MMRAAPSAPSSAPSEPPGSTGRCAAGPSGHRRRERSGRLLAALGALTLAAACVCPASHQELLDTGFQTPRQTFESFQAFLATDLPNEEFRCFSASFRERNGLSLLTYGEGRDELLDSRPWMRQLAKAEIIGEKMWTQGVHMVDARIAGRTVRVKLLREDSYEISAGQDLLADGYCDWDALVRFDSSPRPTLRATVAPESDSIYADLSGASRMVIERTWRIDDLWELEDDDAPPSP